MSHERNIILCQPDATKSCAACCGVFNLRDITEDALARYCGDYEVRARRAYRLAPGCHLEGAADLEKRDIGAHVCPYAGFAHPGRPGCMLHPTVRGREERDRSLFGAKICAEFLCPAHVILTDAEKKLLVGALTHWYPYTVAIVDPESFRWIVERVAEGYACSPAEIMSHQAARGSITAALRAHADYLNGIDGPIFQYSVAEYALGRSRFSLAGGADALARHRARVLDSIAIK